MYLAQRGDINVQLDAGELEVLKKVVTTQSLVHGGLPSRTLLGNRR